MYIISIILPITEMAILCRPRQTRASAIGGSDMPEEGHPSSWRAARKLQIAKLRSQKYPEFESERFHSLSSRPHYTTRTAFRLRIN